MLASVLKPQGQLCDQKHASPAPAGAHPLLRLQVEAGSVLTAPALQSVPAQRVCWRSRIRSHAAPSSAPSGCREGGGVLQPPLPSLPPSLLGCHWQRQSRCAEVNHSRLEAVLAKVPLEGWCRRRPHWTRGTETLTFQVSG